MGWKSMQEWSKASIVAGALVLSGSIAWVAVGPDTASETGGSAASAWELPASARPVIAATASRQLITLNTMDPARVDRHLDAWEQVTTGTERERLRNSRADTRARFRRERETLSGARVSTVLPISSGSGSFGPGDTVRADDKGRAHLLAVVRLTSTMPGGRPVEKLRRYRVYMVLTPNGWCISNLLEAPSGAFLEVRAFAGEPSREDLMLEDVRAMMTALARGERRDVLTGAAVADYDRILRRAGVPPGRPENGKTADVGIIRQDGESVELLVYLNLGLTETVTRGFGTSIRPSDKGTLALRVTIVPDGSGWKVTRIRDA